VRIFASRFVCFDPAWEQPRYFPLKQGEFIQGLLARINLSTRAYVVTVLRRRNTRTFSGGRGSFARSMAPRAGRSRCRVSRPRFINCRSRQADLR
jgi:hypothetical protein